MDIKKPVKLVVALGIASVALSSCSNTQMAVTGLALAGTVAAIGAYEWINNPDAETAVGYDASKVFSVIQNTIKANPEYQITSTDIGNKKSQLVASANGKEVKIVVERIGENASKIYINDSRGKDQAQILLQQITKNIK
jgi:hypothetical protein